MIIPLYLNSVSLYMLDRYFPLSLSPPLSLLPSLSLSSSLSLFPSLLLFPSLSLPPSLSLSFPPPPPPLSLLPSLSLSFPSLSPLSPPPSLSPALLILSLVFTDSDHTRWGKDTLSSAHSHVPPPADCTGFNSVLQGGSDTQLQETSWSFPMQGV